MTERRPLNRDDYLRTYMLLYALRGVDADNPLWAALHAVHEERGHDLAEVEDDPPLGEEFLAREHTHALMVLEALAWGDGTMPVTTRAVQTVCATPGCPNLTPWDTCTDCRLRRLLDEGDSP